MEHCPTCICNPGTERSAEYMRRVADVAIPRDLKLLYAIVDRSFWPWLMEWWRASRDARQRHRPRVNIDFIAHPTRLIAVHHPPKPESRTFGGGSGG